MAESSARLNLRREVIYEDAVLAAYLYESSMAALFGPSIYSAPLDKHLKATDRYLDVVSTVRH